MSDIKIQPSATGSATVTLTAPVTGTARTVTLPDSTDTLAINSDVTNKLPLAGGTLTGDVSLVKASGNSQILVEASGTDAYATVRVKNDAKDYSMQIRSDQSDAWTIRDETAGANRLLISSTGDVTLGTGDLIFGTAGKGIVLGSTTNTDANTLDDYEEGTWTPTLSGTSGGPSGVNFDFRLGWYTKIGRQVTAAWILGMSSWSSGPSGNALVSGLPFNAMTGSNFNMSPVIGYSSRFNTDNAPRGGFLESGASVVRLLRSNDTSSRNNVNTNVSCSSLGGDEYLYGQITYFTA
jgi:hypothetical protein